jgi:DNA-binding transcriptional LysR family regulator
MDSLVSIRVFCLVAELKSFATAAQRLRISPAMASKHVMQLEKRLGTRLLNRTSRRVSLSESGTLYFEQARQMLDSLDEVEAAVSKATVVPRGTLRLTAPVWMANPMFAGVLADYQARYPEVSLDIDLSGRLVNLVEEGFDLALRATGELDEALIARPITSVPFYMVAALVFLKRAGHPETLADLSGTPLLEYAQVRGAAEPAAAGVGAGMALPPCRKLGPLPVRIDADERRNPFFFKRLTMMLRCDMQFVSVFCKPDRFVQAAVSCFS